MGIWEFAGHYKDQISSITAIVTSATAVFVVVFGFFEYQSRLLETSVDRSLKEISEFEKSDEANTEARISSNTAKSEFHKSVHELYNNYTRDRQLYSQSQFKVSWDQIWIDHFYTSIFEKSEYKWYELNRQNRLKNEQYVIRLMWHYKRLSVCVNKEICDQQIMCEHFAIRMDHVRCQLKILLTDYSEKSGLCITDEIDKFLDKRCKNIMRKLHVRSGKKYNGIFDNTCFSSQNNMSVLCKSYKPISPKKSHSRTRQSLIKQGR